MGRWGRGLYEKLGRMGEYVQITSFEILKESKVSLKNIKEGDPELSASGNFWLWLPMMQPLPQSPLSAVYHFTLVSH